jgi:hypothetical protein
MICHLLSRVDSPIHAVAISEPTVNGKQCRPNKIMSLYDRVRPQKCTSYPTMLDDMTRYVRVKSFKIIFRAFFAEMPTIIN